METSADDCVQQHGQFVPISLDVSLATESPDSEGPKDIEHTNVSVVSGQHAPLASASFVVGLDFQALFDHMPAVVHKTYDRLKMVK